MPTPTSSTSSRSAPSRPFVSWPLRENEHGNALTRPDPTGRLPVRRTPKRFRDLDHVERIVALHDALPAFGTAYGFSANLADDFERRARAAPSAASFILAEIVRHVRRELGRPVKLWFCLEEADRRHRLHLHGEAAIEENEKARFRRALRKALGEWSENRQNQTHTAQAPGPNDGWASYCSKNAVWLVKGGIVEQIKGRRINGEHFAASQKVRHEAQRLYDEKRVAALQALKSRRNKFRTVASKQSSINTDLSQEQNARCVNNTIDDTPLKIHEDRATTPHESRESAFQPRRTTRGPSLPQNIRASARRPRARSNHVAAVSRVNRPGCIENRARQGRKHLAARAPIMTPSRTNRELAAQAWHALDWSAWFHAHSRADQLDALVLMLARLGPNPADPASRLVAEFPHDILPWLHTTWFGRTTEPERKRWRYALRVLDAAGITFASADEQKQLAELPERVTIYRGFTCRPEEVAGCVDACAWTLSLHEARNYAQPSQKPLTDGRQGYVARATVPRSAIYARLHDGQCVIAWPENIEAVVILEAYGAPLGDDGAPLVIDGWDRRSGPLGTTRGGIYRHRTAGDFYVKLPDDPDAARSEMLANRLYAALDVLVPDTRLAMRDGQLGVASHWRNTRLAPAPVLARCEDTRIGFVADAWLGNYDVASPGNLVRDVLTDRPIRLDAGGALQFRARGIRKPFGPIVAELATLRDPGINPQAAAVFGAMKTWDLIPGARRLAALPDERIGDLVATHGPGDHAAREELTRTLIARKGDLLARVTSKRDRIAA